MKRKTNWHLFTSFIVILVTIAFVSVVLNVAGDLLINLMFLLVMFLIIVWDYCCFLSHAKVANDDFNRTKEIVLKYGKETDGLDLLLCEKDLFKNKLVSEKFDEYKKEAARIYSKDHASIRPDLRNYFNEDLIDTIVRAEISDQISGAMTGIGIIGTFVGLTIGLTKFNLGSDIDTAQMQRSISDLLEGIKTAFLTSIFGVVYSLIFNFFYKRIYIQVSESMNDFLVCFEDNLVSSPQNDILALFVKNQEIQTDSLSKFSENIASALTKQMNDLLRPTMEYFNTSVDKFLEKSVYSHNESLEAIVSAFIDNMNASMGNQFEELGKTIAVLNETQIGNNEKVQKVVDDICENATDIVEVNRCLGDSIESLSELLKKIENYQTYMNRMNESLLERITIINGYNDRQAEILEKIENNQEEFIQTAHDINQSLEEFNEITDCFANNSEASYDKLTSTVKAAYESLTLTIDSFSELNRDFVSDIKAIIIDEIKKLSDKNVEQGAMYIDSITEIVEEANCKILESAKMSEKIISDSFSGIKSGIESMHNIFGEHSEELVESARAIAEESKSAIESCRSVMETQTEIMETAMSDIISSVSDVISKLNDTSSEHNKQITEVFTRAVSESQKILDTQIEKANEISENMSINMTRSASALDKAYKELENDISRVLRSTFDSFDSGMADISSHLSGTILSNEKSIEKLNEYMEEVPVKLYSIIDRMMKELTGVISEIKDIRPEPVQKNNSVKKK